MVLKVAQRYRAWQELLDFSARLALAGLEAQGFSKSAAQRIWRQRWLRASREHARANRRLVRALAVRDRVPQS